MPVQESADFLLAIGSMLLLGLVTDYVGRRTFLPRVTLLLLLGVLIGDQALALIPESLSSRFQLITDVTLMMVGFLLGSKLTAANLRQDGRQLIWISLTAAVGTTALVAAALLLVGLPAEIAILLGCIAAATAPAATVDTVMESGTDSRFARLLLAIVAVDDAWALVLFSIGLALVSMLNGTPDVSVSLMGGAYEFGGALALGTAFGLPAAYLTGRLRPGKPLLTEALGLVLACGGAAIWLNVSFLIAAMTMGAVVANLARHHEYAFHEIENVEWPLMVIFFILAGASLEIGLLSELGLVGGVYLAARAAGKTGGAWLGASASRADPHVRRWMGAALLPQAGVAIGMALLTAIRFPEYQQVILPVVIGSTVIFELVGPVLTSLALRKAGAENSNS